MSDNKQKNITKKRRRIGLRKRFFIAAAIWLTGFAITVVSTWWYASVTRDEYKRDSERTAVLASQQIMEIAVSSGVSIARNIYANPNIYTFLDKNYSSTAEYYDDYYAMLQNSPTAIAESNAVKRYTVYTANPTILAGGNIAQLSSAEKSDWLSAYKQLGRAMVLYCSPSAGEVSLIRKLDFVDMSHGEAYLKIDLNLTQLKSCIDSIEFDGQIYIVSGAAIVYSSTPGAKMDDIAITHDYCALTKNYYTTDVEFYAHASENSLLSGFVKIIPLFAGGFALGIILILFIWGSISAVRRRCINAEKLMAEEGSLISLRGKNYGSDEISRILNIGVSLSERLIHRNDEVQRSSESLMEKSGDYKALFGIAMRMDAQLYVQEKYPAAEIGFREYNSLADELKVIGEIAKQKDIALTIPENVPENAEVPGMALALAADALCSYKGSDSISIKLIGGVLEMVYHCSEILSKSTLLRLNAIFEDSRISEEYDFSKGNSFNPFLRLKYCCGDSASITTATGEGTFVTIKIILT